MTTEEKLFLSNAVLEEIKRLEDRRAVRGHSLQEARCVFCGEPISAGEFFLLREGDGYIAGCIHCGAAREKFPSVNPFVFTNLARNRAN